MTNTLLHKIAIDYWLEKTGSFEPAEIGATSVAGLSGPLQSQPFLLNETTAAAIKKVCNDKDAGVYLYFLAALHIIAHQYTSAENILVACAAPLPPINGTASPAPLFLSAAIDANTNVQQLLLLLQNELKEAYRHKEYSFENFKEQYEELYGSVSALFNYSLSYIPFTGTNGFQGQSKLAFTIRKTEASFEITIVHTGNYASWFISRLGEQYMRILEIIANDSTEKINRIPLLTAFEKQQVLETFNDTAVDFPENRLSVIELFEQQVRETPEQVAVQFGPHSISYHLLWRQSLQLAALLRAKGIGRKSIVALICERSQYIVPGMLGSLKAGATYVPIDPDLPDDRVGFILKDSSAEAILTTKAFFSSRPALFTNYEERVVFIDDTDITGNPEMTEGSINAPDDPAYIIYTSGSTGRPKGIVILHKGFLNLVLAFKSRYASGFTTKDRCLLLANIAFDASVAEIYMCLTGGSTLVILDKDRLFDPAKLADFIVEQAITFAYIPPVLLKDVFRCLQPYGAAIQLNKLFVGVEAIKDTLLYDYCTLIKGVDIFNVYGPTETTVICTGLTYIPHPPLGENVPIGKPIPNYRIYILNNSLEPLPVGVAGEVCVSGPGVAERYLNNDELTALKFIDDPFNPGAKMFRTGDLAKWTPEGNIIFVGRKDNQVKVRGYRIELGEIESVLLNHPAIKDAVVCAVDDKTGSKYLYAWLVPAVPRSPVSFSDIRAYLSRLLPEYMIPSGCMVIESLPVTSNGKTDRKRLPAPEHNVRVIEEKDKPSTETERKLLAIWKEVLNLQDAGINDNFFESGGHSLKAARLITIILRDLGVEVPLRQVFICGTIKALAAYIEKEAPSVPFDIPAAPAFTYYPASFAQRRLYLSYLLNKSVTNYNMPVAYTIKGASDIDRFEKAFMQIIAKHESLRTGFSIIDDVLVQQVVDKAPFQISVIQDSGEPVNKQITDFIRPFDLSQPPLFRVSVIKQTGDTFILLIDMHHIISDGISVNLLLKEFTEAYYTGILPPLTLQYKDYAYWLNQYRETPAFDAQRKYWLTTFSDLQEPVELPLDFPRPDENTFRGDCIAVTIDKEMVSALRMLAVDNNSTLFLVSFAAYYVLLYKYSGQCNIVAGVPVAGRIHPALNDVIGMFVNTLPIKCDVQPGQSFAVLLNQLTENFFRAMDNQLYPFEELIETLDPERKGARNPLFDTLFVFQNMEMEPLQIRGLQVKPVDVNNTAAKFDLSVEIQESGEEWVVTFNYSTDLFIKSTIERMARHYCNILTMILQSPEKAIGNICLLTEAEQNRLPGFNSIPQPRIYHTIHQLFEAQAAAVPASVAIVCNSNVVTYDVLNKKAEALATSWVNNGLKKGNVVAVLAERNEQLIIGLLAILKAGAIYLPIEPGYPPERIAFMLEDAQCAWVLKTGDIPSQVEASITEKRIGILDTVVQPGSTAIKLPEVCAHDAAYIIYTSGSTGTPKGVVVEHAAIVNYISWAGEYYCKGQPGAMPLFTSVCFDLTLTAIFMPLATGNEIVICNGKEEGLLIEKIITDNRVDIVKLTPAHLRILNNIDSADLLKHTRIHTLIVGGEALERQLAADIHHKSAGRITIFNEYGPTEATVGCMIYAYSPEDALPAVPIGKPIDNTRIYVMDSDGQLCGEGITGEICIAGDGLARGYLNRRNLTDEKFTWITGVGGQKERIYKTGDLGRWLPDGNMIFAGRKDEQLKINGYRIEPGEIENVLLSHTAIQQAVITTFEGRANGKTLVAYFIASEQVNIPALKTFLAGRVPSYMLPAWFIQVANFPLTSNGKINKKALPAPVAALSATAIIGPVTEMEKQLLEIWRSVLETNAIGTTDNFFESGGHSLKALVLVSRIQKIFHVEVSLRDIFNNPTVKALAHYVSTASGYYFVPITATAKQPHYPLSSAQKRIFVMSHFKGAETTYNIYHAFWINGPLNIVKLESAFRSLIKRHESLRTSFHIIDDEPVQMVHDAVPFELVEAPYDGDTEALVEKFIRQFNIDSVPLFRAQVVKVSDERHLLMFDMHHIIADGGSLAIFNRELWELYKGNTLPELTIQYRDYAAWQRSLFSSGAIELQKQYWLTQFEGELPVLNLPVDFPRPLNQTFEGRNYYFGSDTQTVERIFTFIKEKKVTLNMFMLTVYNILLSKYTSQEDIIIGTPASGRTHADLEPIIGMFVNTLALRNYPAGEKTFEQFLQEVKTNTLTAYENQDYPFEELIQSLNLKRDTSRNPLFDTMFLLINHPHEQGVEGLTFTDYPVTVNVAKFDLVFETVQLPDTIEFMVNYNTALFKFESIKRLAIHFIHIIKQVIENPAIQLQQLALPDEEEVQLLKKFAGVAGKTPQQTIPGLWSAQMKKHPMRMALETSGDRLTFEELDQRSSKWAACLKYAYSLKTGDKVAVLLPRSVELPVALLAILKTGAAYIPIDPNFPAGRIAYILSNSGCSLIITDKEASAYSLPVFNIYDERNNSVPDWADNIIDANDLAYITYTSGSTGIPKGVMITHANVVAFTQNLEPVFGITSEDTILAITNITFDISVLEMLCSLMAGITVVIAGDNEVNDFEKIGEIIRQKEINVLQLTPSRLSLLLKHIGTGFMSGIRVLLVGGESMPEELFHTLKGFKQTRIFNVYGPTETCIWSTADEIKDDTITIGKPLMGEQIFIVGNNNTVQPVNIPGEICIAGTGVGKGYYGNDELTREKFFNDERLSPELIYRTGDIGRWLYDGRIEYIGRADNQVKLRGYRIELGEIENALRRYEGVTIAAAVLINSNGEKHIIAFYESDKPYGDTAIRSFLADFLPAYMLPVRCLHIRTMPLMSSGKTDRKALETIAQEQILAFRTSTDIADGEEPVGAIEQSLVSIWKEILNIDHMGIGDNIFERGADSIKLIQVLNRIKKEMGIDLPLTTAFTYTSVKELAEHIRTMNDQTRSEELPYSLINPGKDQIIFCFPPFLGYSFVYTALARYLPDYTLCCFHFQEMGEYLQVMMNMQQDAPFILLGYSYGGNFAFEVAKELEASGREVSDIILIDSYKRWEAEEKTDEELESMVEAQMEGIDMSIFGENVAYLKILKEQTRHKMLRYSKYMNGKIDRGRVNASIHLIRCEENNEEITETAILNRNWEGSTSNRFIVYQGKGKHFDMLDLKYVPYNAAYLMPILQQQSLIK